MVGEVMKRFGRIDVLINNAGIHSGGKFWEETAETWQRIFEVNIMGVVFPSQAVVPIMMKQGKGKVINVSSKAAVVGEPLHAACSASKGVVLSLTRAMAAAEEVSASSEEQGAALQETEQTVAKMVHKVKVLEEDLGKFAI